LQICFRCDDVAEESPGRCVCVCGEGLVPSAPFPVETVETRSVMSSASSELSPLSSDADASFSAETKLGKCTHRFAPRNISNCACRVASLIVKINVSLVWAISWRNVVIEKGLYLA
jgi:hypothetical protein